MGPLRLHSDDGDDQRSGLVPVREEVVTKGQVSMNRALVIFIGFIAARLVLQLTGYYPTNNLEGVLYHVREALEVAALVGLAYSVDWLVTRFR